MSADRCVLIIGGTRGTGLLIAQRLVADGSRVRVLARDPAGAATRFGPGAEIVHGDITKADTLPQCVRGASHIVFTAGIRSGHPARQTRVAATDYGGVVNTLEAARATGFAGRLLYMTSSGGAARSLASTLLNLYKGNTLVWRGKAEDAIRASSANYTIIRAGFLTNAAGNRSAVRVTQAPLPLTVKYRIARADVADAFVAALDHPSMSCATVEVVWSKGERQRPWSALFDQMHPDGMGERRTDAFG
jgi:uncharacterized protein YbjT (DUF2867 family)